MFLASDDLDRRAGKVQSFLYSEPGVLLLLAAVNFEWTVMEACDDIAYSVLDVEEPFGPTENQAELTL